MAENQEIK